MSKRIVIDHTDKFYGGFKAINDVSLYIQAGEFFTLLGPSGCGKTAAILMLPGMFSGAVLSFIATINELSSTIICLAIFNKVSGSKSVIDQ